MCARIKSFLPKIIGFPGNFEPRQEMLDDVMGITINNQGDPYIGDHDGLNTKRFEVGKGSYVHGMNVALFTLCSDVDFEFM